MLSVLCYLLLPPLCYSVSIPAVRCCAKQTAMIQFISLAQCSYICIYVTVCPPCICAVFTLLVSYLCVVCFPYTSVCGLFMCIFYVLMLQCYCSDQTAALPSFSSFVFTCVYCYYLCSLCSCPSLVYFQIGRERGKFSKEVRGKPMRE